MDYAKKILNAHVGNVYDATINSYVHSLKADGLKTRLQKEQLLAHNSTGARIIDSKNSRKRKRLWEGQHGKCFLCRKTIHFQFATIEHLTPRSRGGNNEDSNLKVTCQKCNNLKGNLTLAEFIYKHGHKDEYKHLKGNPVKTEITVFEAWASGDTLCVVTDKGTFSRVSGEWEKKAVGGAWQATSGERRRAIEGNFMQWFDSNIHELCECGHPIASHLQWKSPTECRECLRCTTCGCPSPSPQTHDLYTLTQVGFWLKRLCEGKEIAIKTTLPLEFIEGIKETQKLLKEREELCKKMDDISKLISK